MSFDDRRHQPDVGRGISSLEAGDCSIIVRVDLVISAINVNGDELAIVLRSQCRPNLTVKDFRPRARRPRRDHDAIRWQAFLVSQVERSPNILPLNSMHRIRPDHNNCRRFRKSHSPVSNVIARANTAGWFQIAHGGRGRFKVTRGNGGNSAGSRSTSARV